MDPSIWKRDASKVHAALVEQPDGSVMTTRSVRIYVPERFAEKGLAEIGSEIFTVGICAIVVDDKYYGVCSVNAMMRIKPTTIATVKFDGESYLEFQFEPGSVVIATTDLIKSDTFVYTIFSNFILLGKVPWYIDYDDLAKLFDTAEKHAGVRLSKSHSILEMFAAAIARDPSDRGRYFRHSKFLGTRERPPKYTALKSITLGATNTTTKLIGSYWNEGLDSALVTPSTQRARVEQLLRS